MTKWDNLWNPPFPSMWWLLGKDLEQLKEWIPRVRAEGDKLQGRVKYLNELTAGDVKMLTAKLVEIQKLQEQNKILRENTNIHDLFDILFDAMTEKRDKLEAIRELVRLSKPDALTKILEVLDDE